MSNLLIIVKVLAILNIKYQQSDGEWVRFFCQFTKDHKHQHRPACAINLKSGGVFCHSCHRKYHSIEQWLSDLQFEQDYLSNTSSTKTKAALDYLLTIQEDQSIT